jgi:hypothetical protein
MLALTPVATASPNNSNLWWNETASNTNCSGVGFCPGSVSLFAWADTAGHGTPMVTGLVAQNTCYEWSQSNAGNTHTSGNWYATSDFYVNTAPPIGGGGYYNCNSSFRISWGASS